jgi:hypothetical protein
MFNLTESTRGSLIWPWITHYFLGVVGPLLALGSFNGLIHFGYSHGSAGQALMEYVLLGCIAFVLGMATYLSRPLTADVARKAWIFPLCLFVLAACSDLQTSGFHWRDFVNDYIIFLPGNTNSDEAWDGYWMFSFPVLAALSYAFGSRFAEARLFKTRNPDSQTLD